jgi:hypothetical protein
VIYTSFPLYDLKVMDYNMIMLRIEEEGVLEG